jgi:hypothetical protein
MTVKKLTYILWTLLIAIILFAIVRAHNSGFGYGRQGLGSIAYIDSTKYKDEYYIKYVDTFFKYFPTYKKPDSISGSILVSSYEFLNLTPFYFDKNPKEIYYVQLDGGIYVRFGFNIDKQEEVFENSNNPSSDEQEKLRIKERFRHEILDKIDSLISVSKDKDSAIWKPPF